MIVIDKFFTSSGCTLTKPTLELQVSIEQVTKRLPVVVGLRIDERGAASDPSKRPLVVSALQFAPSGSVKEGLTNTDVVPRRIPLGWTVRPNPDATAEWRNGIALEAALVHEPNLFVKEPRLQALKDERENPFASMISERLFSTLQASDFLCIDEETRRDFEVSCARTKRSNTDPTYLRGRIVILGEAGMSTDRHETAVIGEVPGTVLQANYVEALLDGRYFIPAPEGVNYLSGYLFFVALEASLRGRKPLISLLRVIILISATFLMLSICARYFGYYVDPAVSLIILVLMIIAWLRELLIHSGGPDHDEHPA